MNYTREKMWVTIFMSFVPLGFLCLFWFFAMFIFWDYFSLSWFVIRLSAILGLILSLGFWFTTDEDGWVG